MKKIYLAKANRENLIEITGSEFYRIVSNTDGEPRYFIRLTDDMDFECAEIFIEVPEAEYLAWKKENNQRLYRKMQKTYYAEVPLEDALLFLYAEDEAGQPERALEEREDLDRLQGAFANLTDEEKELIWLLYLCKEPLTETQAASVLHISQPAVHKRKKKILEKMKSFWL